MKAEKEGKAESRKADHISLAFESQLTIQELDSRFLYEPLLSAHPDFGSDTLPFEFGNKTMQFPIWVSSMTGGTELARTINRNLAKGCHEFGLGMGLGSCRQLLFDRTHFEDFNIRPILGDDLPFYANLGIAQLEDINITALKSLIADLQADGLVIHVNPLQEFLQPEGDRFKYAPIDTIKKVIDKVDFPIIVKEVGQGMGPKSLEALMRLPIEAIEFAAAGGTNFSKLELLRSQNPTDEALFDFVQTGHGALQMVHFVKDVQAKLGNEVVCDRFIISGGVKNYLDGYFLINQLPGKAIYGQASGFLKAATSDYQTLQTHIQTQIKGLLMASACLQVKTLR